ncbi:MAG: hydrogenase maturation nickel metallochaperone HypA [Candidatus Hinthialibacter antarcticus]|nr:hydrogenase maturation nickel metallochaperone HypA [Candidatus Hinthialibacter antarcticus]
MHEYSIVEDLVNQLKKELESKGANQLKSVRLRRGSTFSEGALIQAFEMLTVDTPLQGSELIVEAYSVEKTCPNCNFTETVEADDLVGHLHICPECGHAEQVDEASGLEVLEIKV